MNENEQDFIIPSDEPSTKNHFPIVIQLSVLGLVMFGIFGSLIFQSIQSDSIAAEPTETINTTGAEMLPVVPQKIDDVAVVAQAAYVWDVKAQRVLYAKNANEALPLASITKLMTALLAYELIEQDERATIPVTAVNQEGDSGFLPGEQLGIEELTEIALISSSNDAAYALAANVGLLLGDKDPTSQFIKGMNIRAEELGLNTLQFKSTTGLDISETESGAIGSARDVSFLMEYIVTNYPEILAPTQQSATRVYNTAGAYHEVENTNEAVRKIPNMIGSKTGFTYLAGGNLTIAFDAGLDRPIIITVLGSTRDERFTDVLTLVKAVQESVSQTN